ncbi:MAG TPA: zinc-binding dehydrogenase [Ktedonobacterales bacterium]|nr:zinc-binding dehydrogenase [Ktedonobacterales bacterium]
MDAAVLHAYGIPRFGTFAEPVQRPGAEIVAVTAAAISNLDLVLATGRYAPRPAQFPCIAGWEGVGHLANGQRVYFARPLAPYGSMAQKTLVASRDLIPVPDGVDDAVAAALGNAGQAAWLPLAWRAHLMPGETVLVLGATGLVGQLAVQVAKTLGAGRVIAAGRDEAMLRRVQELGADATVNLTMSGDLAAAYREAAQGEIQVIVDYVCGPPAEAAQQAASVGGRLVQIGEAASWQEIRVPALLIRSKALTIYGHGSLNADQNKKAVAYQHMAELARQGRLIVPLERMPLRQVEDAWERQRAGTRQRLVLVP